MEPFREIGGDVVVASEKSRHERGGVEGIEVRGDALLGLLPSHLVRQHLDHPDLSKLFIVFDQPRGQEACPFLGEASI